MSCSASSHEKFCPKKAEVGASFPGGTAGRHVSGSCFLHSLTRETRPPITLGSTERAVGRTMPSQCVRLSPRFLRKNSSLAWLSGAEDNGTEDAGKHASQGSCSDTENDGSPVRIKDTTCFILTARRYYKRSVTDRFGICGSHIPILRVSLRCLHPRPGGGESALWAQSVGYFWASSRPPGMSFTGSLLVGPCQLCPPRGSCPFTFLPHPPQAVCPADHRLPGRHPPGATLTEAVQMLRAESLRPCV